MVAQLTYWSGQGNAEVIRLMMAACGEEWEDRVALTDPPETHMRWVPGCMGAEAEGAPAGDDAALLGLSLCCWTTCLSDCLPPAQPGPSLSPARPPAPVAPPL